MQTAYPRLAGGWLPPCSFRRAVLRDLAVPLCVYVLFLILLDRSALPIVTSGVFDLVLEMWVLTAAAVVILPQGCHFTGQVINSATTNK